MHNGSDVATFCGCQPRMPPPCTNHDIRCDVTTHTQPCLPSTLCFLTLAPFACAAQLYLDVQGGKFFIIAQVLCTCWLRYLFKIVATNPPVILLQGESAKRVCVCMYVCMYVCIYVCVLQQIMQVLLYRTELHRKQNLRKNHQLSNITCNLNPIQTTNTRHHTFILWGVGGGTPNASILLHISLMCNNNSSQFQP